MSQGSICSIGRVQGLGSLLQGLGTAEPSKPKPQPRQHLPAGLERRVACKEYVCCTVQCCTGRLT